MKSSFAFILLLSSLLPSLAQFEEFDFTSLTPVSDLLQPQSWVSCMKTFQCARFRVPYNYNDTSGPSAAIAMIRVPANVSSGDPSYRGPILFNPGGPAASGVELIASTGLQIATFLGPQFDIVSFDPRGVGRSTPQISFFATDEERAKFNFDANARDVNIASPEVDIPRLWNDAQEMGKLAVLNNKDGFLEHVSTDNVARDMLAMVEASGRRNLQYWGVSYGTVLGVTFATLFPDRVERMVIDGVLDSEVYLSGDWSSQVIDAEKTLETFFDGCHAAGPEKCAFFDTSPGQIKENMNELFNSVRANPVKVLTEAGEGVLDIAALRFTLRTMVYVPYTLFPLIAQGLAALKAGDGSILFQIYQSFRLNNIKPKAQAPKSTADFATNQFEAEVAISCGDEVEYADTPDELVAYYKRVRPISSFIDFVLPERIRCSGWKIHRPDRFKGPGTANTSFPILFVGNTADPVTPLAAAQRASSKFPGSSVLVQDSPGHGSFVAPSLCMYGHLAAYFINGTLPTNGTQCAVDAELFPAVPANGTSDQKGAQGGKPQSTSGTSRNDNSSPVPMGMSGFVIICIALVHALSLL